ncbi:MAG: hypothetical protein PHS59_17805 [Paludibacter sp.]|nr:hypothetical protein [Paludibacter sp.]
MEPMTGGESTGTGYLVATTVLGDCFSKCGTCGGVGGTYQFNNAMRYYEM